MRGGSEFVLVDATTREQRPPFDHARLARALTDAVKPAQPYTAVMLPFDGFTFVKDEQAIEFTLVERQPPPAPGLQRSQLWQLHARRLCLRSAGTNGRPRGTRRRPRRTSTAGGLHRQRGGAAEVAGRALFPHAYDMSRLEWREDSSSVTFEYNQRGHQVYRLIEVNAGTGRARALISEEPKTFFAYSS